MKLFDITKDGADEVIVGRDDGRLEVYTQDAGMERKTMQSFSKDIGAIWPVTLSFLFYMLLYS